MSSPAARALALATAAILLLALDGCAWMHRGKHAARCREPAVGGEANNMPALKVPPGFDAPDTRNAIKIPPLDEPERPRGPNDPCLSAPPSFKT
ncbi:MAG: hypothetical protein KGJ52_11365 [Gammaproteobacteria bacterium]|nr:hypothetical protein [Gammaproteobacteria bacterium]